MIELNGSQPMEIKVLGELGPGGNQGRYEAFPWALREGRHILGISFLKGWKKIRRKEA